MNFIWSTPNFATLPPSSRYPLTNWQLSGIGVIQSGAALSVFDGNAGSVYGLLGSQVRAELAPGGRPPRLEGLCSRAWSERMAADAI